MKLMGFVEVFNRNLSSQNYMPSKKARSFLVIGRMPGKNDVFLLHQTPKNSSGTRYKLTSNVTEIFTKFVQEGKATIRLEEPPVDLKIKTNQCNDLAKFVSVIKTSLESNSRFDLELSNLASATQAVPPKPKTKLVISKIHDLPTLEGYPRTLQALTINNCELVKIDSRILRLQNLSVLNLEGNSLETVPPQIELLPNLKELLLGSNRIGEKNDWKWITRPFLQKNLTHLDLSRNKLKYLPSEIGKFVNLQHLNITRNEIAVLPSSMGHLFNLQQLNISYNKLKWIPASFQFLKLQMIDVGGNCEDDWNTGFVDNDAPGTVAMPSLVDLSAKVVLNFRLNYSEETLPRELIRYLQNSLYCVCGTATFPNRPQAFIIFQLRRIAILVTFIRNSYRLPMAVRACSTKCHRKLHCYF